jgi:NADH:ubiquinone oxidoreductase subunit 4 (subunit M)
MQLLSYLIFSPLVAALLALFIPARLTQSFRVLTLAINVLQVAIMSVDL